LARSAWTKCWPLAQIVAEYVPGDSTPSTIYFMNCRPDADSKWIEICRLYNLRVNTPNVWLCTEKLRTLWYEVL
jgi:hypothetical protein